MHGADTRVLTRLDVAALIAGWADDLVKTLAAGDSLPPAYHPAHLPTRRVEPCVAKHRDALEVLSKRSVGTDVEPARLTLPAWADERVACAQHERRVRVDIAAYNTSEPEHDTQHEPEAEAKHEHKAEAKHEHGHGHGHGHEHGHGREPGLGRDSVSAAPSPEWPNKPSWHALMGPFLSPRGLLRRDIVAALLAVPYVHAAATVPHPLLEDDFVTNVIVERGHKADAALEILTNLTGFCVRTGSESAFTPE